MQQAALEQGLGVLQLRRKDTLNGLQIRGMDPKSIKNSVLGLLEQPSPHFVIDQRRYSSRVISKLQDDATSLCLDPAVKIDFLDDTRVQLIAVETRRSKDASNARLLLTGVIETIEFWVGQEGYNQFATCICCAEENNLDQGIKCQNGHFFCSTGPVDEQCFATMATSQFECLRSQENPSLVCAQCSEPFNTKTVAAHLPEDIFRKYQATVVDVKVAKQVDELSHAFNQRLQSAVQAALEKYGNANASLRQRASQLAQEARDTVLNLHCPHCDVV